MLLVDDDPDMLSALGFELESFADVKAVGSVNAALPLIIRGRFDVAIADLRMPDRWGDELLAHLAARSPGTLRIILTGDSNPRRTVRELIDTGLVQAIYAKPRAEGLIAHLRDTLRDLIATPRFPDRPDPPDRDHAEDPPAPTS